MKLTIISPEKIIFEGFFVIQVTNAGYYCRKLYDMKQTIISPVNIIYE